MHIRAFWFVLLALPSVLNPAAVGGPPERGPMPHLVDLYGDPLPEGAVARLGSVRLRHPGLEDFVLLADGKTAVTVGKDQLVRRWDLATGRQTAVARVPVNDSDPAYFALSADGSTVAIHQRDELRVCDTATGRVLRKVGAATRSECCLAVSADGATVACGPGGYQIMLVDVRDGRTRDVSLTPRPDPPDPDSVARFDLRFSRDGRRIVARGLYQAGRLAVVDVAAGREVFSRPAYADGADLSPDGSAVATCEFRALGEDRRAALHLYDVATGRVAIWEPEGLDPSGFWVTFSPDGQAMACAGSNRGCLVDVLTGRALRPAPHRHGVIRFSPDGSKWAAHGWDRLELWDAGSGRPLHDLPGEFNVRVAAASADGRWLADRADGCPGATRVWDLASGRVARQFPLPKGALHATGLAFGPDGRTLSGLHGDGVVRRWRFGPGGGPGPVRLWGKPQPWEVFWSPCQLSPDGRRVAALVFAHGTDRFSFERRARRLDVWDAGTGAVLQRHALPLVDWSAIDDWLPDGSALLVRGHESFICVDPETGRAGVTFPATDLAAVSADSRLVAGWKRDPELQHGPLAVWEVATGRELLAFRGDGWRWSAALAASRRAVVVADGRSLRVVDLVTGADRGRRDLPSLGYGPLVDPPVRGASILSGDDRVLTALEDGTALVWDLTAFPPARLADRHGEAELRGWWDELAGEDAVRAYAAGWNLAEAPADDVVRFLRKRVQPIRIDLVAVRQRIADLDSPTFAVREVARLRLMRLGPAVLAEVRKSPPGLTAEAVARLEHVEEWLGGPVPPADMLRVLRAVAVLERVGTGDARRVLEHLAHGADAAPETKAARSALGRMSRGWGR